MLPNPALATAVVIGAFILAMAVLLWTTYPTSERVEHATAGPTASDKPTQTPEKVQPSPAPTEQTAKTDVPPNQLHENRAALPIRTPEESLIVLNDAGGQVTVNPRGRLEGLPELPPDLRESVEKALATRELHASPALTDGPLAQEICAVSSRSKVRLRRWIRRMLWLKLIDRRFAGGRWRRRAIISWLYMTLSCARLAAVVQ